MATLSIDAPRAKPASASRHWFEALEIAGLCIGFVIAFAFNSMLTLVGGTFLCVMFLFHYRHLLPQRSEIATGALIVMLLLSPAFFKPGHGFSPIFYLFSTVVTFATAFVITRFSARTILLAAKLIYWIFAAIVGVILAVYWGSREPFGEVIEGASTNGIPAYMIVIQLFLSTITYIVAGRVPIVTPVLTFMIAFYGSGRGSLIVGALLVFGSLVINLFPRKMPFFYRATLFVLSIGAMGLLIINAEELFELVSAYTKLSVGVSDSNRAGILDAYMAQINPLTFFLGADYRGTIIEYTYEGNPHISFIRTHSFFGIFAVLMAILSPAIVFFAKGGWSLKLPILFFISLALVRAATEPILFPTLLDVFYFAMFFMFFRARDAADVRHG